jgi:hypothetical protein
LLQTSKQNLATRVIKTKACNDPVCVKTNQVLHEVLHINKNGGRSISRLQGRGRAACSKYYVVNCNLKTWVRCPVKKLKRRASKIASTTPSRIAILKKSPIICKKIQEISVKISPVLQAVNSVENGVAGRKCTRLTRSEYETQCRESRVAASISEDSRRSIDRGVFLARPFALVLVPPV